MSEDTVDVAAEAAQRRLMAIQTITDAGLRSLAVEDSLPELLARATVAVAGEKALILVTADDGNRCVVRASHRLQEANAEELRLSLSDGIIGRMVGERLPLMVADTSELPRANPAFSNEFRSFVGAPLLTDDCVLGVVLVGTAEPHRFSEEDLQFIQIVADRAASLLEYARLFQQVRAGRERAQALSQQLMEAQEVERRRLARELHDEIGQALTAVKINLQAVQRAVSESHSGPQLEESISIVDRALQQVRNLSLDLRPSLLDDLGLVAALRWYLDRQVRRAGFEAAFSADPAGIRAETNLETTCFRVAQEAITNIIRHAKATQVRIELRRRGAELQMTIADNGTGFEVEAARQRAIHGGSLGLLGMQERVLLVRGRIDIKSKPGNGTEIHVRLPMAPSPALERRSKKRKIS